MLENTNKQAGDDSIEQLLGSFSPAPTNIDRDQLMFLAGMRAAQAASAELPTLTLQTRLWPALAMVSTAAAVVLAFVAWQRPERIVIVERPVPPTMEVDSTPKPMPDSTPQLTHDPMPRHDPAMNYVQQRELVLRDGPDALNSPAVAGGDHIRRPVPTQRELLMELPGGYGRQKYQIDSEAWWHSWLISGDRL